jgi:hypothetical protein
MNESLPRVRLRPIVIAVVVCFMLVFLVWPLAAAVVAMVVSPLEIGILVALVAVAFAAVAGYLMSRGLLWVELDGEVIRERRLLTRKIIEHRVEDIIDAKPIDTDCLGETQNAILDFLLDTKNRGYQLFFRDGSRLALIRADLSGLDPFLVALADQIRAVRDQPE